MQHLLLGIENSDLQLIFNPIKVQFSRWNCRAPVFEKKYGHFRIMCVAMRADAGKWQIIAEIP
jgi:hypothetical protein